MMMAKMLVLLATAATATRPIGYMVQWIVDDLSLPSIPAEYIRVVKALNNMRAINAPWERPGTEGQHDASYASAAGLFHKVPPEQRLVAEELCPWKHVAEAMRQSFPDRGWVGDLASPFLEGIDKLVSLGDELPAYRQAAGTRFSACATELSSFAAAARDHSCQHTCAQSCKR